MADNLPLIPSKRGGCDGDVRKVLRAVFRDRCSRLPPLGAPPPRADGDVSRREAALREERARRLTRPPPPNQYTLHAPRAPPPPAADRRIEPLAGGDLIPRIEQSAVHNEIMWVRNALARSSIDISALELKGSRMVPPAAALPLQAYSDCRSVQSLSIGEPADHRIPPHSPLFPEVDHPDYVICIPSNLDFINFTVGRIYTHVVRIVNISAAEVRLALRPPARRELDVELRGRLQVTSGATTELRVHFRPRDVRALRDELRVRVSLGRPVRIPIACYMEPPVLEVVVPNVSKSALSCVVEADTSLCAEGAGDAVDLGARLLGDTHYAPLLLRCHNNHVAFFIITEDAWNSLSLQEVTGDGTTTAGPFAVWPAWWRGGGALRGAVRCRAPHVGLHTASLRVLSSNAVIRPFHLLADSLYFHHQHITLQAQEKDYDICSDDDPDCEYYVHLGTAFRRHALSASVLLVNHSPINYAYYWTVRAWGECCCWQEELAFGDWLGAEDDVERLCVGAREAKEASRSHTTRSTGAVDATGTGSEETQQELAALRVEPARGSVAARGTTALHVAVPDVGDRLGTHRAVLMLVLCDIPRQSFPPGYRPMIMSSKIEKMEHISGFECAERELCDVLCCQLEVWWRVSPLRFALEPAALRLPHSRRVTAVELPLRATQLYAGGTVTAAFSGPTAAGPLQLSVGSPSAVTLRLPLSDLPNHYPVTNTITLEEEHGEWKAQCVVERHCDTRHPALRPHGQWLGLVPPGAPMRANLTLVNDTYQDIYWWADVFRLWGENPPKELCQGRSPCEACFEQQCTCDLLQPQRGGLDSGRTATLRYAVNAPLEDGCVATLVRARRCAGDLCRVPPAPASAARAALLAYRVLAVKLALNVLPCASAGDHDMCYGCELSSSGGAVIRAARALVVGRRSCCRLRVRNLTPLATRVVWEPAIDGEKHLRIIFIPNEFDLEGHGEVEIRAVVEARAVCERQVWVRRAAARHAHAPLYLLIDAAVSGVEVEYWLPLLEFTTCLHRIQREELPWDPPLPTTEEDAFAWEDRVRDTLRTHICPCKTEMQWVAPPPVPLRWGQERASIEIVSTPPPLTPVCACWETARPLRPLPAEVTLQMRQVPLRTVRTLRIRMRSVCVLTARWSARARLGAKPRQRTLDQDVWAHRVLASGACVSVSPARGTLGARATQDLELRAYADSWGLYHDQILIMTEKLAPLVLDLWVEVVGCPLQFMGDANLEGPHTFWVSEQDPVRTVRARNTSRAALAVQAYMLRDHESYKDAYPFRLCIRFFDVLPPVCPCCFVDDDFSVASLPGESSSHSSASVAMDTGVEIYLAPDHGVQCSDYYQVEPREREIAAGEVAEWRVVLRTPLHGRDTSVPLAPDHTLVWRMLPVQPRGPEWFRPEPPAVATRVRAVMRVGRLQLSHDVVTVKICALSLPFNDVMRIRKRICVQNVGDGHLSITARVADNELQLEAADRYRSMQWASAVGLAPAGPLWRLLAGEARGACGARCEGRARGRREVELPLNLPPSSSTEICVELFVRTSDVVPPTQQWDGAALSADSLLSLYAAAAEGNTQYNPFCRNPRLPLQQNTQPYEQFRTYSSDLQFYDDNNVLKTVGLVLELELPLLLVEPAIIDFGYVCDGDSRKTYFSVSHTSHLETVSVYVSWVGGLGFRLAPTHLLLAPGARENVYVQCSAKWTGAVSEGWAVCRAAGGAWCAAAVRVLLRAARDLKCGLPTHDHTDEPKMLPPIFSLMFDQAAPEAAPPQQKK